MSSIDFLKLVSLETANQLETNYYGGSTTGHYTVTFKADFITHISEYAQDSWSMMASIKVEVQF